MCVRGIDLLSKYLKNVYFVIVDGKWSDWSEPLECSVTCGGGVQTMERSCNNPAPLHGGKKCEGNKIQTQKCNEQACPGNDAFNCLTFYFDIHEIQVVLRSM